MQQSSKLLLQRIPNTLRPTVIFSHGQSECSCDLVDVEDFNEVTYFYIGIIFHPDTTFYAVADFASIILEPPE